MASTSNLVIFALCALAGLASADVNTECHCASQMHINVDATEGYLCSEDPSVTPNGYVVSCLEGQILVPNFDLSIGMECIDTPENFVNPGVFDTRCPGDEPSGDFDASLCECNGQLIVSADCKESFYCYDSMIDGGVHMFCPEGEVWIMNFLTFSWSCQPDEGQCMGTPGYTYGCAN